MKVLVVNPYPGDIKLYGHFGKVETRSRPPFNMEGYDLVAFTGGEDVNPASYQHRNLGSHYTNRDGGELLAIQAAVKAGVPMIGICRGAQILNVAFGGTMVQDIRRGHNGPHKMCTIDGKEMVVNSLHHQIIVPGLGTEIQGWCPNGVRAEDCIYDGNLPVGVFGEDGLVRVTEAIYSRRHNFFAVQFHPEWLPESSEAVQWYLQKIETLLLKKEKAAHVGGDA